MSNTISLPLGEIEECDQFDRKEEKNGRWLIGVDVLFRYNGKVYAASFDIPATEMQEGSGTPDNEVLECPEMHEVEKVVKAWEPVP